MILVNICETKESSCQVRKASRKCFFFRVARSFERVRPERMAELQSAVKSMTTRDHLHRHVDISGSGLAMLWSLLSFQTETQNRPCKATNCTAKRTASR